MNKFIMTPILASVDNRKLNENNKPKDTDGSFPKSPESFAYYNEKKENKNINKEARGSRVSESDLKQLRLKLLKGAF